MVDHCCTLHVFIQRICVLHLEGQSAVWVWVCVCVCGLFVTLCVACNFDADADARVRTPKNTFKEALTKPSLQGLTTCAGPDVRVCCPLLLYLFIDIILLLFHAPFSRIPALFLGISYSRRVSRQGPARAGPFQSLEERVHWHLELLFCPAGKD